MLTRKLSFIAGAICGLSFAPIYFLPGIFMLSVLCAQIHKSKTSRQAALFGYWFGFGFFLVSLYWISIGVTVYVDEFWWAVPFALLGLPAFLALFTTIVSFLSWKLRTFSLYHILFCVLWLFMEWIISWIFTGLPWAMLGYALSISDVLIQTASIFGILGISFIAVFIGSIFYSKASLLSRLLVAGIILSATIIYGVTRLEHHPTEYSKIKVRIVQPSIKQLAKWNPESFWQNMTRHIAMSQREGDPDIIVWSEAALTVPFYYKAVHKSLLSVFTREGQVLLTGGINDNNLQGDDYELYSSLIALNSSGELLFDYHKSHLVPFGEYMPLKKYLPIKKLTPGLIDYTPGNREVVYLPDLNLKIHALVCYESIFFSEVKALNTDMDLIVNIINDAWYGNSSGPHQHFQISRLRSVENGLPMIRAGNNGISAIIDPLGRVLKKLDLNAVDIIDGYLPYKLSSPTLFSKYGNLGVLFFVGLVLILQRICSTAVRRFCKKRLFT